MEKIKSANNNNNINIAEILKDCPKGTKLYSPICGEVEFNEIDIDNERHPIALKSCRGTINFAEDGHFCAAYDTAECMLFPSSKMRDWTKFFKRGDVVCSKDGSMNAIFDSWANDDYTEFNTTINYNVANAWYGKEITCSTIRFVKASDEERAAFIANAEKYYNGKFNPETLQVEPVKPECPFKPFDKVLMRDSDNQEWEAGFFSHYDENCPSNYYCIGIHYKQCIPYEGNEHLLGTTDPYTEGGSE